jgi:hypothetical protein
MNNEFGFKELYEVSLKTTYPIEVDGNAIEAGETVAFFDKIQIANFQEVKNSSTVRGGFDNRGLVFWDSTKEIKINFSQGVFSKAQYSLMSHAQLLESTGDEVYSINARKTLESDEKGNIEIAHNVLKNKPIFIYDLKTGEKVPNWNWSNNNTI